MSHLQEDIVRYKKYFYALRPLLACRYAECFHTAPPVRFDELLEMELEPALRRAVDGLLEKKKVTTERELYPQIPEILDFIREELEKQKAIQNAMPDDRNPDWSALDRLFVDMIGVTLPQE